MKTETEPSRSLWKQMTILVLFLIPLFAVACGTLEVGIERTPLRYTQDTATPEDAALRYTQDAVAPKEVLVTRDRDALVLQPVHATDFTLGDCIQLLGYDFEVTPHALIVAFYWQATEPVDKSYNVFVHVFDSQGGLQGQRDSPPVSGRYPTFLWQPGQVVVDNHLITLPSNAPTGAYRVAVGMYDEATQERLPVLDGTGQTVPEGQIMLDVGVVGVSSK
jgi:hypothetical protein